MPLPRLSYRGKFWLAYFAVLFATLLGVTSCFACDSVQVDVLPLSVSENYDLTRKQIEHESLGVGQLGVVFASPYALVDGCHVVVGYRNVRLFVASELVRDPCSFQHVLDHERRHVEIYREALATLESRIAARLGESDLARAVWQEVEAVRVAQNAHDNPFEYATNLTACRGRIVSLTGLR